VWPLAEGMVHTPTEGAPRVRLLVSGDPCAALPGAPTSPCAPYEPRIPGDAVHPVEGSCALIFGAVSFLSWLVRLWGVWGAPWERGNAKRLMP